MTFICIGLILWFKLNILRVKEKWRNLLETKADATHQKYNQKRHILHDLHQKRVQNTV